MNPVTPPQNIDAEASLLGSILLDGDTLIRVGDKIDADDFYEPRHSMIYAAMQKLYEKHRPIDVLTLTNTLEEGGSLADVGGASYITDLTNMVPTSAHAEHYADIIRDKAIRRRLIKASEEITRIGQQQTDTIDEALADAERELFSVTNKVVKQDLTPIDKVLDGNFDRLDELHKNRGSVRGLPTGFKELDNMLAGLQQSDLIVLAGRPAMGKSAVAMNMAHHIASKENQSVLVFSLEMSKEQLVDRLLSAEAGVDSWNIRTGNLTDRDFEKLGQAMGVLSEAPIYIDDTPGITPLELRTKARREQQKRPIGLIIIDYLQLMAGSTRTGSDNRVQEVSEISRSLKGIARELNVPVLALSQLSRSVESRHPQIPQLADLRESGSIEQDADVVMFLYREDYYNPETDRKNITDLFIKKHRNGPVGSIELYFHPELLQFRSLTKKSTQEADIA